jgi:flagellar hook-associated protein 1 FlgK
LSQAQEVRDTVSGVNLDEEAANLLRFQQAYQAIAQVISAAETTFQTLLNAVGR